MVLPPPTEIVGKLGEIVPSNVFLDDLGSTAITVFSAFAIGAIIGLLIGIAFWKLPFVGAVFEPYLVSMYSMPALVFYPILLALLGLSKAPIVVIAASMALIPIALNTMVALRAIKSTLPKLGTSLNCTRRQIYWKILAPAATPLVVPGLVLGFIYAMIGTIAMEFILASNGIGFRIGYYYRSFDVVDMYAYILVASIIAIIVNVALNRLERRIRRDMQ
ncbi:MAG: ABC transporter permease subunit [Pseudonocardiaceae bacterium]|nr:ABC transporter permease subunit [Pseudonocardiaceae bacterium]